MRVGFPAFVLYLVFAAIATAEEWQLVPEDSQIRWTAKWNTTAVNGGFRDFDADIVFDTTNLSASKVTVGVETGTIYMDGQDARSTLINENWFAVEKYPQAVFETREIRHLNNGRYEADAILNIRGHEVPVTLPFKLTIEGDIARVEGSATLDRKAFGLGLSGDVASAVAPDVSVSIAITASREAG